jgi:phosphoheptose isomerase
MWDFTIKGSGNSPNVLPALEVAGNHWALAFGMIGFEGGEIKSQCDIYVILPSNNMQII